MIYGIDNSSVIWMDIDLSKVSQINSFYDKKNDTTSATFE